MFFKFCKQVIFFVFLCKNGFCHLSESDEQYCPIDNSNQNSCSDQSIDRYLLYDVNHPEGFNLRRDVYLRYAIFAHNLQKLQNFRNIKLVLPPWPHLYHWTSTDIGSQDQVPWGDFFDIESLQKFAPVIEMYQFVSNDSFRKRKEVIIDATYTLENVEEMFESGIFENKLEIGDCKRKHSLDFYGYGNVTTNSKYCVAFQGHVEMLKNLFKNSKNRVVMVNHAEIALHDMYGSSTYWMGRRSMRFSRKLVDFANKFREINFNSTDENDGVFRPEDWRLEKSRRQGRGGNYLCSHLRRQDFVYARPTEVPSIEDTAKQLKQKISQLKLTHLFIATDAPESEYILLKDLITHKTNFKVTRFEPTFEQRVKFKDGGIAIIDQIICSHAAYFIGSYESTFTFRIQEEREILGFKPETTFNRLCGSNKQCPSPSKWKIVF